MTRTRACLHERDRARWAIPLLTFVARQRNIEEFYRAMVEVLLRISRGRVMLMERSRREREIRARGRLSLAGFVDEGHRFEPAFDSEVVDLAAAKSAGLARGLRFAETEKAADAVDALNDDELRQAKEQGEEVEAPGAAWRQALALANRRERYALELAESYARDRMASDAAAIGLDVATLSPIAMPRMASQAGRSRISLSARSETPAPPFSEGAGLRGPLPGGPCPWSACSRAAAADDR